MDNLSLLWKQPFSNGCYNKEMTMWHVLIKLPILKWYCKEKILHKDRYLSLDSLKNWIILPTRTKSPMHVETAKKKQNNLEWCDRVDQSQRIHYSRLRMTWRGEISDHNLQICNWFVDHIAEPLYSRGHGFKPRWSPDFFRLLYAVA